MAQRNYSSTAVATTLANAISNAATTCLVVSTAGFPAAPFIARIDADTVYEEIVLVTNVAGTTLTITRGYDSTSAQAHSAGASFRHAVAAVDLREANQHINASSSVHGLSGAVVGTTDSQTLSNKTLASPTFSGTASGSLAGLTFASPIFSGTATGSLTNLSLTTPTLSSPTVNDPTLTLSSSSSVNARRLASDTTNGRLLMGDGAAALQFTADNKAATLTNKTISGASNTLSSIPSSAVTGLDAHTAATAAHGATGAVVGTTNSQTLTNKTISGASNTVTNLSPAAVVPEVRVLDRALISVADATPITFSGGYTANSAAGDTGNGKLTYSAGVLTATTDVTVDIWGDFLWDNNGSGQRRVDITAAGTIYRAIGLATGISGTQFGQQVFIRRLKMTTGQTISVTVLQSSGGALDLVRHQLRVVEVS